MCEPTRPELSDLDRCNEGLGAGEPAGAYIASVLAQLPNVGYTLDPIGCIAKMSVSRLWSSDDGGSRLPGTVLRCSEFPVANGIRIVGRASQLLELPAVCPPWPESPSDASG